MTVGELRRALNGAYKNASDKERFESQIVGVIVKRSQMGSTPTVGIRSSASGFDWNRGKYLLFPEGDLIEVNTKTQGDGE